MSSWGSRYGHVCAASVGAVIPLRCDPKGMFQKVLAALLITLRSHMKHLTTVLSTTRCAPVCREENSGSGETIG